MDGQCIYYWTNGQTYVGSFFNGNQDGLGTLTLANGDKYVGQFIDGKFNGQGTYNWFNGDRYIGFWKNN